MADDLLGFHDTLTGSLKIGASTIPGTYLVPGLVRKFRDHFPKVKVSIEIHDSEDTVKRLLDQQVDAAIVDYLKNGYELAGILGIQSSPSCDPVRGIFMEELTAMFAEKGIELKTLWYLPNTSDPVFDSEKQIVNWLDKS